MGSHLGHADLTGPYQANHIKQRFIMGPIQVIVKYDEEVPVKFKPPMPTDSVADTMYFISMMREEGEEARRKARDELILRMAMEQKSRQREVSKSHYLRL